MRSTDATYRSSHGGTGPTASDCFCNRVLRGGAPGTRHSDAGTLLSCCIRGSRWAASACVGCRSRSSTCRAATPPTGAMWRWEESFEAGVDAAGGDAARRRHGRSGRDARHLTIWARSSTGAGEDRAQVRAGGSGRVTRRGSAQIPPGRRTGGGPAPRKSARCRPGPVIRRRSHLVQSTNPVDDHRTEPVNHPRRCQESTKPSDGLETYGTSQGEVEGEASGVEQRRFGRERVQLGAADVPVRPLDHRSLEVRPAAGRFHRQVADLDAGEGDLALGGHHRGHGLHRRRRVVAHRGERAVEGPAGDAQAVLHEPDLALDRGRVGLVADGVDRRCRGRFGDAEVDGRDDREGDADDDLQGRVDDAVRAVGEDLLVGHEHVLDRDVVARRATHAHRVPRVVDRDAVAERHRRVQHRRPRSGSSNVNIVDITAPTGDWLANCLRPLTR